MYKIITRTKRGRRYREISYPDNILVLNHLNMNLTQVRSILVRVILAERKSGRIRNNKKLMPYAFRLRRRRIELAHYYSSLGGKVSPLLFLPRLPVELRWPGIIGLVETKGYEDKLIANIKSFSKSVCNVYSPSDN